MRRSWTLILFLLLGCTCVSLTGNAALTDTTHENVPADFLRDSNYTDIVIEVTPSTTATIDTAALGFLASRVFRYCHKEQVIIIVNPAQPVATFEIPGILWWTSIDEAQTLAFEQHNFKLHTTKHLLVLHIAVFGESFTPNDKYTRLGQAWDSHYIALYRESLGCRREVLLHEFGHVLGLVNNSTHTDPEHTVHCKGKCIMYWTVKSGDSLEFCPDCLSDLTRSGGCKHYW